MYSSLANKTILAENFFFPCNFTDVDLPEAKLTAADFKVTPDSTVTVSCMIHIFNFAYSQIRGSDLQCKSLAT